MITKNSVILAEPIVLGLDKPLVENSSDIVKGLMELSYGAMPYGETYRTEIAEVTADNGHTDVVEHVTTKLAESIREVFSQISTYGIGFARVLANELRNAQSDDHIIDAATSGLAIRFVNLDNDFLVSTLYPAGPKNVQFNYDSIDLSVIDRLQFNTDMCGELAKSYIDIQHPDIVRVMKDDECDSEEAFYSIMDVECLRSLFHHQNGRFDFTTVKTYRLALLFKMYVILSKMYSSDDPIKSLVGGTLTDYREYVSLLWNGLSTYLARMKGMVGVLRGRGIALHQNKPVRFNTVKRHFDLTNSTFEFQELHGDVTVFYTKPAADTLAANNYCLRDWVIGRLLCDLKGEAHVPDAALLSGNKLTGVMNAFMDFIRSGLLERRREVTEFLFQRAVNNFVMGNETLREFVAAMDEEGLNAEKIVHRMNSDFKCGYNLAVYLDNHPGMSTEDAVISSGVVQRFLRAIDCSLAANIIAETEYHSEHDDAVEKRKRLHAALIKVLVNKLMG
ncbi:hypothetical protein JOAD_235 [Erwinia phage vB_EamM_Joad]|uniref:Uncharacterized protein n=1 Tax=Erwinia phage vB_EamM_Joad TaxID=2026081 RepID=A0A223LI72_9CAUD|nr:hypothetical protein JOAD_235 [Erwinia phage vB_EamM_Joad]